MTAARTTPRHLAFHLLRLACFLAVVTLVYLARQRAADKAGAPELSLADAARHFPGATKLLPAQDGMLSVQNGEHSLLGYVLQTSPASDGVIGFSGPTNTLLAFDPEMRLVGQSILDSQDTRDHVAQVVADAPFMQSLVGRTREEIGHAQVASVSGATLTSLAIRQGILARLADQAPEGSLKFPDPPQLETVQSLFPNAEAVRPGRAAWHWVAVDAQRSELGTVLSTAPAADNIVGYQGPTQALVGLNAQGQVVGLAIAGSFDNEPYVGYVREDKYFRSLWNGQAWTDLAELDLQSMQVEGVSGATMTSMAVAEGLVAAAKKPLPQEPQERPRTSWPTTADLSTVGIVLLGLAVGLTRRRAARGARLVLQILLVIVLGFGLGNLVSLAMLAGWAGHGVPWRSALGLVVLAGVALVVPLLSKRNVYCTHLCPHGALQQWTRHLPRRRDRPSAHTSPVDASLPILDAAPTTGPWKRLTLWLRRLPGFLLFVAVLVTIVPGGMGLNLVDLEPFDAYLFPVAGVAAITIAVLGLAISCVVPMAYCRFGCPTGSLLEFLRFNARSNVWSWRDWVAVGCVVTALVVYLRT